MKKATILIGAGAALPWGAPKTEDLTNLLLNDSKAVTKSGKPFGLFLKELLENYYGKTNGEINIESLLNAVEILYEFFNNKNIPKPIHSHPLWTSLFEVSDCIKKEIPDYNIVGWGINNSLNVRFKDNFLENDTGLINKNIIEGYFFYLLYKNYVGKIVEKINGYQKQFSDAKYKESTDGLIKFFNCLKHEFTIRVYSLNYDSLIPAICNDIEFFQGFTERASNKNEILYPDIPKIITNAQCHSFYNLHGSINFTLEEDLLSSSLVERRSYYDNSLLFWHDNPYQASVDETINSSNNKPLLISNIVAGSEKVTKTLIEPLRSFQNSFQRDCIDTDKLIVIGYSYSNFHHNSILRSSLKSNRNLQFINITLDENVINENSENFYSGNSSVKIILDNDPIDFDYSIQRKNDRWSICNKGKFLYYFKGYKKFLIEEDWNEFLKVN